MLAYRTAQTTFMKQTQDFQVALARTTGEMFAAPTSTGVTAAGRTTIAGLIKHFSDYAPHDVLISNDPFSTDGLVTHQMDIHLARPIFYHGDLIAFAWSFVHASDVGGAVPGSISPELSECFQEGFRIRPTKLVRSGVLNQDVVHFVQDNSRIGDQVWGDLESDDGGHALAGRAGDRIVPPRRSCRIPTRRRDVMDYAEAKARSVIADLRDGEYRFSDYLELENEEHPVHGHCRLSIRGDEAEIDFEGSDPQVGAALSFNSGGQAHQMLCIGLTNYIETVKRSIPLNAGMVRPIQARAPSGTVMNATFPAAMGNRWMTAMRCNDSLMGCLNQAIPGRITACGAGQTGIIFAAWQEAASGRTRVAVVEPFCGGSGGRTNADGVDAIDTMLGFLKSTPTEHVESETPLLVRKHALVPSSFGHGRYRGGASVHIELECQSVQAQITVRGLERQRFQAWGVQGGHPGRSGETWLLRDGKRTPLGRVGLLRMQRGDLLSMVSPSDGGFGDPLKRPAELVLEDVSNSLLQEAEAEEIYGVIIRSGVLDVSATEHRRAQWMAVRPPMSVVVHGQTRREYERMWSNETSAAFCKALLRVPLGLRAAVRREAEGALRRTSGPVDAVSVSDLVSSLLQQLQTLN